MTRNFSRDVTTPLLHDHNAAHLALANLSAFVMCALADAGTRGDGQQQIMPDLLAEAMPRLEHLFAGTIGVSILHDRKPMLTVVPGGKKNDPEPAGAA
ncbi:MAG: hypothetical protein EOQ39_03670 [Mesorhizobium sp.]|uniref:hypothetical protein n=1 Tax=Mesorhizobium sp. TaxID=1871066 RepID=UPI000FE884EF|nr:hypothetical protein [Mesorhizobium sp.]RWB09008.1 MAG: hypothetical protein EOQ37_05825 [Mesorhizobium sp.]RWB17429.1 MAG: hypothetical protein EOQ39_03670 [Mesorhizobium sp.]